MPISLNPLSSQTFELLQPNTTRNLKRTTTKKMVEDALIQLHTAKGVTLKYIYDYILTKYNLASLSKQRVSLVKKHLLSLRETKDIFNTTGKGFSGRIKLVDKNKFIKKIATDEKEAKNRLNATKKLKAAAARETNLNINSKNSRANLKKKSVKRIIRKPLSINVYGDAPVIPRQVTPLSLHNNASMFDTPMVATQVHASTPFISAGFIPRAPEVHKRKIREEIPQDNSGTPRSSLGDKKRRKLHNRP